MSIWVKRADRRAAVSVSKIEALDRRAIETVGIPGPVLMENAGRGVAEVAARVCGLRRGDRVLILCGKGNNGGDGFAAARYLKSWGARVGVWMLAGRGILSPWARLHYDISRRAGVRLRLLGPGALNRLRQELVRADLVVDALLGTGLSQPPREPYGSVIREVNRSGSQVLAVDVPSGLDADRGIPLGEAVRAKVTATCGLPKKGFFLKSARPFVGRVWVVDIGLPEYNVSSLSHA